MLMVFVMQTAYDQKNNYAISIIHDIVYAAKEEARAEGSFTWDIQDRLRANLCHALALPSGEVLIECSKWGDRLYYRVEVPIKGVMAGNSLFGIKDKDNQFMYVIDSYIWAGKILNDSDDDGDTFDDPAI